MFLTPPWKIFPLPALSSIFERSVCVVYALDTLLS